MEEYIFAGGIKVIVEDKTKHLSGDLYMVRLEFSIVLPLEEQDHELISYCGDYIRRTRIFEKPAVLERDLEQVKNALTQSFFATNTSYLNHAEFASRLKRRTLIEMRDEEERKKRRANE